MGLTQRLGTIPLAIQTDSSNNVGIGGAANASYKLAVTGASLFTGAGTFNNAVSLVSSAPTLNLSSTSATGINEIYFNRNTSSLIGYMAVGVNSTITGSGDEFIIDNRASGGGLIFRTNNAGTSAARMTITSAGQVTTPNQTYFYARAALGGQDFSSGSGTILYPNVDYNVGNAYNSSTSTFTAPVSGVYVFSCQMFNRPSSNLWVYWTINGVGSISLETQNDVAGFVNFYSTITRYLAAGDTMRLVITTSSGYVAHTNGSVGPGSFFSGYLLG